MSKTSFSDRNDLSTEVRLTFAWKWVIHWGRQTLNANLSSRAKTKRKVQVWRGHAPWRSQWFLSFGPSARFRTATTVSFFASASPWTSPASNQSMIWEQILRRIVNRLSLWYYLAFRVVILHDRHLPSIAAHNNSHRGCRPRQPRETQHCTLCTELAFSFEQIMNHFPDPGHNPWLQLAFPLKFLWFTSCASGMTTKAVTQLWSLSFDGIQLLRLHFNGLFATTHLSSHALTSFRVRIWRQWQRREKFSW